MEVTVNEIERLTKNLEESTDALDSAWTMAERLAARVVSVENDRQRIKADRDGLREIIKFVYDNIRDRPGELEGFDIMKLIAKHEKNLGERGVE